MESPNHILKLIEPNTTNEVVIPFETAEAVSNFLDFFRDLIYMGSAEPVDLVVQDVLEPGYYYISLDKYLDEPLDAFKCAEGFELGKDEEHNVYFYGQEGNDSGLFVSRVLADCEGQAVARAVEIRNEAVYSGDWDSAWQRHVAMSRMLDSKRTYNTKQRYR